MRLILLRHGESEWNLSNKFTGWTDVDLTTKGIEEAKFAAKLLIRNKIFISTINTSILLRAVNTSKIVAHSIDFNLDNIIYDWRLNERHYGSLQGLNKSETARKYGEDQVLVWRRSYDVRPPLLDKDDKRHPVFNKKFNHLINKFTAGESLKDVIYRLEPFWKSYINSTMNQDGDHLIVAHSNSLRAIIKILENLSEEQIVSVNIPTGIPLVYTFDNVHKVLKKEFLINENILKRKQSKIENQGKIA